MSIGQRADRCPGRQSPLFGQATALGGSVVTPKEAIPGFGWYAILHDTEGNLLGLYETAPR